MSLNPHAKAFVGSSVDRHRNGMNEHDAKETCSRTIYCDLDGVLADFDRGCVSVMGTTPDQLSKKSMWKGLAGARSFCKFAMLTLKIGSFWVGLSGVYCMLFALRKLAQRHSNNAINPAWLKPDTVARGLGLRVWRPSTAGIVKWAMRTCQHMPRGLGAVGLVEGWTGGRVHTVPEKNIYTININSSYLASPGSYYSSSSEAKFSHVLPGERCRVQWPER